MADGEAAEKRRSSFEKFKERFHENPLVFVCECRAPAHRRAGAGSTTHARPAAAAAAQLTTPTPPTPPRRAAPHRAVLGLTVAALTRGLGAMVAADRRQSQLMMRYRVLFQLCTVGSVVGGIYYNAYKSITAEPGAAAAVRVPAVDHRVWLQDASKYDLAEGAAAATAVGPAAADAAGSSAATQLR